MRDTHPKMTTLTGRTQVWASWPECHPDASVSRPSHDQEESVDFRALRQGRAGERGRVKRQEKKKKRKRGTAGPVVCHRFFFGSCSHAEI